MLLREDAIRDMLKNGIDLACISTLLQCTFREVLETKESVDTEALMAARVKSALAMHCISPATESRRADKEHGIALRKMAKGDCKHESRVGRVGRTAERSVSNEDVEATRPRGHGFTLEEE